MVKCKVVEIRWHDMTPIFSADFHAMSPEQHRKSTHGYVRATGDAAATPDDSNPSRRVEALEPTVPPIKEQMWRLATCGGDKHVRLWLVRPHPLPPPVPVSLVPSTSKPIAPAQPPAELDPSVEYLATLRRHTAAVNVVRFNPVGDMLASASDDGNIIFWVPGVPTKSIGDSEEDTMFEREQWRAQTMCRTRSGQEIYDLCFSPNGAHIVVGSIDHTANIWDVATGQLIHTIAEHASFVQGVAWDPYNHYIATQSSDRSMHVYSVAKAGDGLSVHAVGKNSRMEIQHQRGGTWNSASSSSVASGADKERAGRGRDYALEASGQATSTTAARPTIHARSHSHAGSDRSESSNATTASRSQSTSRPTLGSTDASSATPYAVDDDEPSTPMDPPHLPPARPLSRRSSTSGSHPSHSPGLLPALSSSSATHPVRSPSPAPLPAIRVPLSPTISSASSPVASGFAPIANPLNGPGSGPQNTDTVRLYTDLNATFYFRRLAWSPDGSLLLTPAGMFEDPYAVMSGSKTDDTPHKPSSGKGVGVGARKKGAEKDGTTAGASGPKPTVYIYSRSNVARPPIAHLPGHRSTSIAIRFCPVLWKLRDLSKSKKANADDDDEDDADCVHIDLKRGETAHASLHGAQNLANDGKGNSNNSNNDDDDVIIVDDPGLARKGKAKAIDQVDGDAATAASDAPPSLFDLPYRMVYAVATLDCVYLYDTQQAGPIAMFANLHYAPFTDLTWSPDGQTLVLSAEDGYCTVVAFEENELGTPYERSLKDLPEPPRLMPVPTTPTLGSAPPQVVAAVQVSTQGHAPAQSTAISPLPAYFASAPANTAATVPPTALGEKRVGTNSGEGEGEPAKKKKKAVLVHHGPLGSA